MKRAEALIKTLTTNPNSSDDGSLANELLREFHRGFPVERLRPLLSSRNDRIVGTASFVADELGSNATSLLDTMVKLLHYRVPIVRADAIGSILTCATEANQKEIAAVISMLADPDWPIRWKTMEFISRASLEQLTSGLRFFETNIPSSTHVCGLRWLTSHSAQNVEEINSWVRSDNPTERKYGVVAATRLASSNRKPLMMASSIEDADVNQFAHSMLKMKLEGGDLAES